MKSNTPFRIVIVGGGIAGLTAAIALHAPNRRTTVLEQSRLNTEIGALISLQPNATKIVYDTFGLGKELEDARGMIDEGFRVYSTDGELVNQIPLTSKTEYGASRIVYHRRDLHDALKQAALATDRGGEPVQIKVSSRVTGCDLLNGSVDLESGEKVEGDIIIGADGIHSVLREYVLDNNITPMPTGHSGQIPSDVLEEKEPEFCKKINARSPFTSMMVAHNCRLVMGPGRQGELFGIVALVPDEQMNEDPNSRKTWVSKSNLARMMDTFSEFPNRVTSIFKLVVPQSLQDQANSTGHSPDLGLWQLHDIDPLSTWYRGRLILIGDAAHAMLPTQGQGASQAIEDSETLGAFFDEKGGGLSSEISTIFQDIFRSRHRRASFIQAYSRQAAKPGTEKEGNAVTMKPDEFMAFNCMYRGAREWLQQQATSEV
ncbi:hypothetical protein BDW62DRAFT_215174 [Aspergillus aurantiobrunneus]